MGFEYSVFCEDPVWEKQRALDLIFHYTTAFLELVLNEEQDAINALTLPAGYNPGVSIETHD
jgi:hypothetical protein